MCGRDKTTAGAVGREQIAAIALVACIKVETVVDFIVDATAEGVFVELRRAIGLNNLRGIRSTVPMLKVEPVPIGNALITPVARKRVDSRLRGGRVRRADAESDARRFAARCPLRPCRN